MRYADLMSEKILWQDRAKIAEARLADDEQLFDYAAKRERDLAVKLTAAEARLAEALQHRAVLLAILRDGIVNAPCPTPTQWREVQDMSRQLLAAADSASVGQK